MKTIHIIGLVVIAGALALIIGMMPEGFSRYATFSDAAEAKGREFHVAGKFVAEKGLDYNPKADADRFSFYMIDDEGKECRVICTDDMPQDFELAETIVVIGEMDESGVFHADDMLTKCPSKYQEDELN